MFTHLWPPLITALYRRVGWPRARLITRKIAPHLVGNTLLDLGAGTGHTAVLLQRNHELKVTMLDVAPHSGAWGQRLVGQPIGAHLSQNFGVPRVRYDGRRIPFEDASFDTVLIAFVLHHCKHPDEVLREATRVARSRVLVLEDCGDHSPTRAAQFWDALFNLELFHPHQERTRNDWLELFERCGVLLDAETQWQWHLGPLSIPQNLFVLDAHN